MNKEFLTVSELNNLIQEVIHSGFPQPVWVCGEIQGYNRNRSKSHIFFELIEKDENSDKINAKVGLVLFSGRKAHINEVLTSSGNPFLLKDDIEVKFACSIDFYPPHGALRLIVESIDPAYTLGKLAQEKQKLIAELKKKGILDKNKQCELSLVPLNIGLITADDSAAYNDFISELKKSGIGFKVYLRNCLMQGKSAEKDICSAIHTLGKKSNLDCLVITRGGGSIADLSCFDSKKIAEKIADCPLPVLSGIGHEINTTITDMAAHTHAKTPTAIAKFLVDCVQDFVDGLDEKADQIIERANAKIEQEQQKLKDYAVDLQENTRSYLKQHNEHIIRMQEVIRHKPAELLSHRIQALNEAQKTFKRSIDVCLTHHKRKLANYQKMIDIAHPVNTIKRGFTITRTKNGNLVRSVRAVKAKESLVTEVADGKINSEVLPPHQL